MARRRRTVEHLAERAGIGANEALETLRKAGLRLTRAHDVVPKNRVYDAEFALGLAAARKSKVALVQARIDISAGVDATAQVEPKVRKKRRGKEAEPLRTVGREQSLGYVTFEEAVGIHWQLVADFKASRDPVDPPGIKSENLLHSALSRCMTSLGSVLKYPTAPMAAAALLHSMVLNHPFHNGNKRTALVALLVFLDRNGWSLRADEDELFDFVLSVASHTIENVLEESDDQSDNEVIAISSWIQKHTVAKRLTPPRLKFHDLRSILNQYDCAFDRPARGGNRINIHRGRRHIQVWYGDEGREVMPNTIKDIRRELELDEAHGYDHDIFYNSADRLPDFIIKYRSILERLAKT